jgi:hypothetical protein
MSRAPDEDMPSEATIAAYLSNRLDDTQAEAFEAYCLNHPEFARRVELDLYLKVGFKELHGADRRQRARRRWKVGLGIAASLLVIFAGVFLVMGGRNTQPLIAYRSAAEVPAALRAALPFELTLLRLRDSSTVRQIVAPPHVELLTLRLLPDGPGGQRGYSVTLTRESPLHPQTLRIESVGADADGYLKLYLPLATLLGHTLAVTVTPAPGSGGTPPLRVQIVSAAGPQNQQSLR